MAHWPPRAAAAGASAGPRPPRVPMPPPHARPHFRWQPPQWFGSVPMPPRMYPGFPPPVPHMRLPPMPRPPPRPPAAPCQQPVASTAAKEAKWLDAFTRKFVPYEPTEAQQSAPPLRRIRSAFAKAQTLVGALQEAATDAVALEKRIASLGDAASCSVDANGQANGIATGNDVALSFERLEVSRLKLQRDRKLARCAALRDEIEAMGPKHLFCGSGEELEHITRFAKLVHKKQAYRKKAKQRRQVNVTIQKALERDSASDASQSTSQHPQPAPASASSAAAPASLENSAVDTQRERASARETAKKLLLLVDMKMQRKRNMDENERHELERMREKALQTLERVPKRRKHSALAPAPREQSQDRDAALRTLSQTSSSAPKKKEPVRASNGLVDPETIDMETLVRVRRAWDQHLVAPATVGASSIPPHFVPPPPTPSAQWAAFLLDREHLPSVSNSAEGSVQLMI